jgi:hypothetical protein
MIEGDADRRHIQNDFAIKSQGWRRAPHEKVLGNLEDRKDHRMEAAD